MIEVIRCYEIEVAAERINSKKEYDEKFSKMKSQLKNDLSKPFNFFTQKNIIIIKKFSKTYN